MVKLKRDFDAINVDILLLSADSPQTNRLFRDKYQIPFHLLSDEDHAVADRYQIPISHKHPKARSYKDGFIQPAVFVYRGEQQIYGFIQKPCLTNLWGASRRPHPRQILESVHAKLTATKASN